MSIEMTSLYQEMRRREPDVVAGPDGLMNEFERLRTILREHSKFIILLFPEYTPHDHSRHLDHLFALADRVLGTPLYRRLSPLELLLFAFALYAHDWGMAVSESERQSLLTGAKGESFGFLARRTIAGSGVYFQRESHRHIPRGGLARIRAPYAWSS